jgi:hypothetical protein
LHLVKRIIKISWKDEKKVESDALCLAVTLSRKKIKKFQGKEEKNCTSMPALDGSLSIFCLPFILSLHFNKPGNKRG